MLLLHTSKCQTRETTRSQHEETWSKFALVASGGTQPRKRLAGNTVWSHIDRELQYSSVTTLVSELLYPCYFTLLWGTSTKQPILCRVGRKTL